MNIKVKATLRTHRSVRADGRRIKKRACVRRGLNVMSGNNFCLKLISHRSANAERRRVKAPNAFLKVGEV